MLAQLNVVEIWTKRLNPSELYAIERRLNDNPVGGGGQLYIQVTETQAPSLLKFIGAQMPALGSSVPLQVRNPFSAATPAQTIDFWAKSQHRMRTGAMNRFRASNTRPGGWSPAAGFPTLPAGQDTDDARALLAGLGHVHVYLARDASGTVWAGYTKGQPTPAERALPFARIAWGPSRGGYWP